MERTCSDCFPNRALQAPVTKEKQKKQEGEGGSIDNRSEDATELLQKTLEVTGIENDSVATHGSNE